MEKHPKDGDEDFSLPTLNPLIKLFKTSPDHDGTPRWTLHLPASNQYYQIGWAEFECLARFHQFETAAPLKAEINAQTTLDIDWDDIKALIMFLQKNSLLILDHKTLATPEKPKALWKKLVHGYLFFTIPLFKPTKFLKATLPYIRPFLSKTFITIMLSFLLFMIFLTFQRLDEFTHTFLEMFSLKGAFITFFVFTGIKIIHEMAHAYTATKYGVNVPHMGVAFIVMYPVLYTETTGSWQLSSVRARMAIGLAGVMAELSLAAIFLLLWHILPPGMGRSISFSVVAISMIGSLFVNLNPLMRFDGYFVVSDALGIENLHARAMALTRWKIRDILFGLHETPPDNFSPARQKFMMLFGLLILIYRFFLFLGIAFLVYYIFFKPLGLIMMGLELLWFILLPIWGELKQWWLRRSDIIKTRRSRISLGLVAFLILFLLLPLHTNVNISGVLHQSDYRSIYASVPSNIKSLNVKNDQSAKAGQILLILESDPLEKDLEIAKVKLEYLQIRKSREQTNIALYREHHGRLDNKISQAAQKLHALQKQKERLIIKAPFDGIIRDLRPEIHKGRWVSSHELLFTIIGKEKKTLTAYIGENQLARIEIGNKAKFYPKSSLFSQNNFIVESIDPTNAATLLWPELSSIYGGNIPAIAKEQKVSPLESIYRVKLKPLQKKDISLKTSHFIEKGQVRIKAHRESVLLSIFQRFVALIIRESSLN